MSVCVWMDWRVKERREREMMQWTHSCDENNGLSNIRAHAVKISRPMFCQRLVYMVSRRGVWLLFFSRMMWRQNEDVRTVEFNPSMWRLLLVRARHVEQKKKKRKARKYKHTSSIKTYQRLWSVVHFFLREFDRLEIIVTMKKKRREFFHLVISLR